MAHAGIQHSFLVLAGVLGVTGVVHAAPGALTIAETPSCRVGLTKVSYDDPGADDGEFIELFVERLAPRADGSSPPPPNLPATPPACNSSHADAGSALSDASTAPDSPVDAAPRDLTLADCGLSELRLVNGGSGTCDDYRVIPLGAVAVPADGFVVVCAQDSVFGGVCDVNTAGRSAIRNGFLQNGPNDGIRFADVGGTVSLEVGYEGGPSCFSGGAKLIDETGDAAGEAGQDDVNVVCEGRFELQSATGAALRTPNPCPAPAAPDAGDAGAPVRVVPVSVAAASSGPLEFAPDAAGYPSFFSGVDAAFAAPSRMSAAPLEPPSCGVPAHGAKRPSPLYLATTIAAAVAAMFRRPKRRPRRALRADCSVGCERAPRR